MLGILSRRWALLLGIGAFLVAIFVRVYALNSLPPSLYWEEVALGYDAYSILRTGRDFHGQAWPLVAFESFGDWKPSLYFYSIVPMIALFGLNEWAVRLPSALAGLVLVAGVGYLAKRTLTGHTRASVAVLLGVGVAAISPWAVIFSRGGWEANLATALLVGGVVAFTQFLDGAAQQAGSHFSTRRERWVVTWFCVSVISLCLAMYAYHAARVVAPLVGIGLLWLWWRELPAEFLKKQARFLLIGIGICSVLLLPILLSLRSPETSQRFNETNIFADLELLRKSQQLQAEAGNTFFAKIVYHRYSIYLQEVLRSYLSHFQLDFLFIKGDQNLRHSIQYMGQLYHIELVFVVLGFFAVLQRRRPWDIFLLWWMAVGIFPAALTHATPHALRILSTLPVWLLIICMGIVTCIQLGNELWQKMISGRNFLAQVPIKTVIGLGIFILYVVEFSMFWRFYTVLYPQLYGGAFNDGEKQMILAVQQRSQIEPELPVVIMRSHGRPSVYYWFYTQTDPHRVQIADATASKDQGEFLTFENVSFPVKTEEIVSPAIVAVTVENYPLLTGKALDMNDPNLIIITTSYHQPIWVVMKY